MNVNSVIQKPLNYDILDAGVHEIRGLAWSGHGSVKKVEISFDNGITWKAAILSHKEHEPYAWVKWKFQCTITEKGEFTILSRATDTEGNTQPLEPFWNKKGYGYNAVARIKVKIE